MNKILLVLIIASGFLLIFYANTDLFRRKTKQILEQTLSSASSSPLLSLSTQSPFQLQQLHSYQNDASQIDNTDDAKHYRHQQQQHKHSSDNSYKNKNHHHNNIGTTNNNNNNNNNINKHQPIKNITSLADIKRVKYMPHLNQTEYNIFIIYTKQNYVLKTKFELFVKSLLKYASIQLHLHIISDKKSEQIAEDILKTQIIQYNRIVFYTLYDVEDCAIKISDITHVMMPYFSSHPGSYYSDALFFLSLGLHRIVDSNMRRAILIDCDVVFRTDVKRLFDEFDK